MRPLRLLAVLCLVVASRALPAGASTQILGWQTVQALPIHTLVQVRADTRKGNCHITAVTEDQLTCSEGSFPRAEIKTIKLPSKGRSIGGCTGAGAAIGAGGGAIIMGAQDPGNPQGIFYTSRGRAAAGGLAVGAVLGGGIGAIVGATGHHFSRTIYQR